MVVSLIFWDVGVEDETENLSAYVMEFGQCAYIRIETLCGNKIPINHALLKEVYGNATLDRYTVQWWLNCFKGRRESTGDNPWSGRTSAVITNMSIAIITAVVNEDQ